VKAHPGSSRRRLGALAAVAPLVALLSGCSHATDHRTIDAALVNGAAGFDRPTITVDKEDTLALTVGNTTDKTHGFSIEGYGIKQTVDPGKTIHVKFRLGSAGTFKIFCQLHPTHQTATLVVR
jgi:plastocyanin